MATTRSTKPIMGLTFEKVWASLIKLQETQEKTALEQEKTAREMKDTFRQMKKDRAETERVMKDTFRQIRESQAETDRQMGGLSNRFGEMVEYMVMPNLLDRFRELNFVFTKVYPDSVIRDENNKVIAEIDITLENGDKVMLAEVKSRPTIEDVKDHVRRMNIVRSYADSRNDKRKYLGTIGGMVVKDNVKQFAFKNGFYVAEPSGETFNILVPASPLEW